MKLLTFLLDGRQRLGALVGDLVVDLSSNGEPALGSMQSLIESGADGLEIAQRTASSASAYHDPSAIDWCAPLPVPTQMRDCLSFEAHLKNSFESAIKIQAQQAEDPVASEAALRASGRYQVPGIWYDQPIYYKANRFSVAATGELITWPTYSNTMDFELELACIIGRAGKDIPRSDADEHIFGYTIFNDFSARDTQIVEQTGMLGPAKGKDFDKSSILGPVIVTRDELSDPYDLFMRARINGELICDGHSSTMHWRFADMIAHISKAETLYPGEVIGSGTVGWGCGLEHMRFLKDGDEVELEIEGIGRIRNRVEQQSATKGSNA